MVLKRLFGRPQESLPRIWRAPVGCRLYAVGDIHGRRDLLDRLIDRINQDDAARGAAQTQIIFLGDLIDRGSDSRGVVERLIAFGASSDQVRFLSGNHEEILIRAWGGDKRATGLFNRVGGRETMLSYGMTEDEYDALDLAELAARIADYVPRAHIDFLESFDDYIEAGDYLFVHAGIRPGLLIAEQETSDLRWIRKEFTEYDGSHSHMIIHGHSITEDVDAQPNRIGIDTGAFASGKLTAIGIEDDQRWFLST
jgi:serine/threonine protein phosphatase 1